MTMSSQQYPPESDHFAQAPEPAPGAGPPRSPRHRRLLAMAAVAAIGVAAGGGISYAASASAGSPTLTRAEIRSRTNPAVVDVVSTLGYAQAKAAGTGIVLTSSGEILTNNHVIDGATSIKVTDVGNGRVYQAVVVGYDVKDDIAVLQLRHASGLTTATIGNSAAVRVGQSVTGIGNAGGKGGTPSAVAGKITATGRTITASDEDAGRSEQLTGMIESNAKIRPGDSGGPLVDSRGRVIGINTAASSGVQLTSAQSAATRAYAIPINRALSIASAIEAGHATARVHIGATAFLGVEVTGYGSQAMPGAQYSGVTVAGVVAGSPAARAGLQAGDTITAVGGQAVSSTTGLHDVLAQRHPGNTVSITWLDQAGQSRTATVSLASGPAA